MLVFGTILALCLLNNALVHSVESGSGRNEDQCSKHARSWVSCSAVNSTDALLPHPDDCSLFYYCPHPALPPVCRECPAGLHFNTVSHVCDWPEQSGCQEPDTEPPQTEAPANASEFEGLGYCPRPESPVSCEDENPLALIPHPEDCQSYYICIRPKLSPICLQCPGDLHFNPESHICEPSDKAGCEERNSTSRPKQPADSSEGPGDSSEDSGDSSKGPGDSSKGPGDSSKGPGDSSKGPGDSSKGPGDSSEGPGDSSEASSGSPPPPSSEASSGSPPPPSSEYLPNNLIDTA